MTPRILQINVSSGGVPKRPITRGEITHQRVRGDDWSDKKHHGLPGQAICLFAVELIEELRDEGYPLFPGALGENLTTQGLNYRHVRPGQIFSVGEEAIIRITKVRVPCRTITIYGNGIIKALFDAEVRNGNVQTSKWGRSGFYAEVLSVGTIYPGDPMILRPQT
ncbi:MAG: MOSC domain-containing protein [Bacteroidota bacterium]